MPLGRVGPAWKTFLYASPLQVSLFGFGAGEEPLARDEQLAPLLVEPTTQTILLFVKESVY